MTPHGGEETGAPLAARIRDREFLGASRANEADGRVRRGFGGEHEQIRCRGGCTERRRTAHVVGNTMTRTEGAIVAMSSSVRRRADSRSE